MLFTLMVNQMLELHFVIFTTTVYNLHSNPRKLNLSFKLRANYMKKHINNIKHLS